MNSTPTHSLDELRAAVKAETPNENKRSVRRRELEGQQFRVQCLGVLQREVAEALDGLR